MSLRPRPQQFAADTLSSRGHREYPTEVELLILGGGISGASLFSVVAAAGKPCLLVDRNDYASGTSQASGMMIWGGLLYLTNAEFGLVSRLCRARDWLIEHCPVVQVRRFSYLPPVQGGRPKWLIRSGLAFYRVLSGFARGDTRTLPLDSLPFPWDRSRFQAGLSFEEAFLSNSDAQYTYAWLHQHDGFGVARNYCEPREIRWDPRHQAFDVILRDRLLAHDIRVTARQIVNCCGIWTDQVNQRFGMKTRHCHHLSKGVYLLLQPKQSCDEALVVDMGLNGDTLCWVPWGPVVMWGPTETDLPDLEKIRADREDVEFLLAKLNGGSVIPWTEADIVNVRCGVRPLAKTPGQQVSYSLDLSRHGVMERSGHIPWWSVFGGKISGEYEFAQRNFQRLFHQSSPRYRRWRTSRPEYTTRYFGGMSIKSPAWCVANEQVVFLEDYLRRRTNIAQWVPRGGFGRHGEFSADIHAIAGEIHSDPAAAQADFATYRQHVIAEELSWKSPQYWEDLPPFNGTTGSSRQVSDGRS